MLSTLTTVWLIHLAATAMPGANTLVVLQLAASNKRSLAAYAAVGVAVGSALWATLAVLGVNAVFAAFPRLRIGLQIIGGAYLFWLAVKLWRTTNDSHTDQINATSSAQAFRLGLLTNFSNPKAALFFGSIFSAILPPTQPALLATICVALVFVNALVWYNLIAYVFSRKFFRAAYLAYSSFASRVAAVTFGTLGTRFAVQATQES